MNKFLEVIKSDYFEITTGMKWWVIINGTLHHYSRTSHFRRDFWDFLSLGKVGPCYFSYRIQVSYGEYLSSNEKDYSRCPRNQFLRLNTPWDSSQGQVFSYTHPVLVCRFEPIGDASELWRLDWHTLLFYFLKPLIFAFHTEMKEAFSCHFRLTQSSRKYSFLQRKVSDAFEFITVSPF